jgi:hypothetical protein
MTISSEQQKVNKAKFDEGWDRAFKNTKHSTPTECVNECQTVKFYPDKKGWRCMSCFREFIPTPVDRVETKSGVWVLQPLNDEEDKDYAI